MGKRTKEIILGQKTNQREAYWSRVRELMKEDEDIVLVVADQGAPAFDLIRKEFPARFIYTGIAEQNAILIASGLAMEGKKVMVHAIASFIIMRCYEQIRISNSVMGIPLTIVGIGAGFSYDDSGPTHHLLEDIALMRVMPGMTINSVTDNQMARQVADFSVNMTTPNYVRLDRHNDPNIYTKDIDFSKGFEVLRDGQDGYIISTGVMVRQSLNVAERLSKKSISLGVIDIHTIPCKEDSFINAIKNSPRLITLEEHFLPGGLGSYVVEMLADNKLNMEVKRLGLSNGYCYRYGGREDNWAYHGVDEKTVLNKVEDFVKMGGSVEVLKKRG